MLVHVCDDCGGQYAPEIFDEVCACLDREGARHLTEIEVVPCDKTAIERIWPEIARLHDLSGDYAHEIVTDMMRLARDG